MFYEARYGLDSRIIKTEGNSNIFHSILNQVAAVYKIPYSEVRLLCTDGSPGLSLIKYKSDLDKLFSRQFRPVIIVQCAIPLSDARKTNMHHQTAERPPPLHTSRGTTASSPTPESKEPFRPAMLDVSSPSSTSPKDIDLYAEFLIPKDLLDTTDIDRIFERRMNKQDR